MIQPTCDSLFGASEPGSPVIARNCQNTISSRLPIYIATDHRISRNDVENTRNDVVLARIVINEFLESTLEKGLRGDHKSNYFKKYNAAAPTIAVAATTVTKRAPSEGGSNSSFPEAIWCSVVSLAPLSAVQP